MIHPSISCCYLYAITKYGYPPDAGRSLEYLREMKALGFSSVELEGIREDHLDVMYEIREDLKNALRELELVVPYFCVVLPGLSSYEEADRHSNLVRFRKGCEIAKLLGSKGVLDNAPLPPYQFPANIPIVRHYEDDVLMAAGFPDQLNWETYWNNLVNTYREACDIALEYGLTYNMHPCAGVLSATTDAYLFFSQQVQRSNLRFNLDTANQFFLKDNLSLSLIRLVDHIDYIHLSDNRGEKIEHLVPGDGAINWDEFFHTLRKIGYKGEFGIDVGGAETGIEDLDEAYRKSAAWLERRLVELKKL